MCDCGCNTCETKSTLMLNESLAPRDILSEGLKYHMDNNKPLTEHVYRAGSDNYFNLWAEARSLYSREILEITDKDDLEILNETDLGHFGMFEGKTVRFGSGGLRAKINDPKARQAFAKRHKCSTKKDRTKASYWSCRLPRYAKLLGLKSSFSGFW